MNGSAYGFIVGVVVSPMQFSTRDAQQSLCSGEFGFGVKYERRGDAGLFPQNGDVSGEGSLGGGQG